MSAAKIATSVPGEQFQELEKVRRRLGLKRCAAVQEALALWLAARDSGEKVTSYLRGYMNHPEDADEAGGFVQAWAEGIAAQDW